MKKLTIAVLLLTIFAPIYGATAFNDTTAQKDENTWVDKIAGWYEKNMNYASITGLMVIESSFIPFPSEVVVPPAAAISVKEGSRLNIFLIIIFATIGAIIGAIINYLLALWLGRPIIYKFADSKLGHICLLSSEKIKKAEDYFNEHGKVSTLVGRLIPGIRQLISIPAGLAKMSFLPFIGFTALGAGIWNIILAVIGYFVGDNMELINKYSHEIGYIIVAIIALTIIYFIVKHFIVKRKKDDTSRAHRQ
jgi:membrane protein DedA with SNARE-associated domain